MVSLQGPVICPAVRAKEADLLDPVTWAGRSTKLGMPRSEFWGFRGTTKVRTRIAIASRSSASRKSRTTSCCFSSSADGDGSMADNFNENDEDYINTSVVEAVEVKIGVDCFKIKMRDGRHLRCLHNNPQGGHMQDYAPHPAMVLKMEDGSGLLLPIVVLEMQSAWLMAAVRNVRIARPTLYEVVTEMIDRMGYEVKLVRVTRRVHEAYFAQLYMTKAGTKSEFVSFNLRPSDAINIAVRCKVPIQVNKYIVYRDGMRVIESGKGTSETPGSDGLLFTELDRPNGQPCIETKEFDLVRNMLIAAGEERYRDAAQWRDKLSHLRAKRNFT